VLCAECICCLAKKNRQPETGWRQDLKLCVQQRQLLASLTCTSHGLAFRSRRRVALPARSRRKNSLRGERERVV
jgi:hypothetical protein